MHFDRRVAELPTLGIRGQGTISEFDSTGNGTGGLPVHCSNPQRQSWNVDRLGLRNGSSAVDEGLAHVAARGSGSALIHPTALKFQIG
jgi:hypothetical protein